MIAASHTQELAERWGRKVRNLIAEHTHSLGEGLAGWVAQTGKVVYLRDAYDDPRFDRTWDERSGYRTRSLLCVPILDRDDQSLAVIQCLNKQGRSFDEEDED